MRTRDRASRRPTVEKPKHWFHADEGQVHEEVFRYVSEVERQQFDVFNRFVQLEVLYDPNTPTQPGATSTAETPGLVIENMISSCVDTVASTVAAPEVRPRFMTTDGGWSKQRLAKRLEWYCEDLGKTLEVAKRARSGATSAIKKGTGVAKVFINQWGEIKIEHVRIDDLVVDEAECRNGGTPRQMHRRMVNVDREELKAMFPDHEEKIDRAQRRGWDRMWAGYRPVQGDELVVIESHKLPIGRKGTEGYRPGRHTICIDGCDLLDEEWHKPFFPYAVMVWTEREGGFYGISLTEGIAGIQRALNKRNLQIDRSLDQFAFPTTYVSMADAHLAIQTINRIGSVVPIRGEVPKTVIPPAVSPEVYQHRGDLKASAYENSGVSRMAAQAVKPAGIDSGVAMREYRDQTTQRFALPEKAFEQFVLDIYWLILDCCKELGDDAPEVMRKAKFGTRKIRWADADMGEVKMQMAAASTLSRTPAGRYQTALEWAQAGVITVDEWRKLIDHPDLDHVLSLYTQGMESVELDIEAIEEGYAVQPEPFGNLQLMARMGQVAYLRCRDLGGVDGEDAAPEEVLEGLRQYTVMAAHLLSGGSAANQNGMSAGGDLPAAAGGPLPPAPTATQPVAAVAPEGAALLAG